MNLSLPVAIVAFSSWMLIGQAWADHCDGPEDCRRAEPIQVGRFEDTVNPIQQHISQIQAEIGSLKNDVASIKTTQDQNFGQLNKQISELKITLIGRLDALPSEIFTDDVRAKLIDDVIAVTLDRMNELKETIRAEILAEVEARLREEGR